MFSSIEEIINNQCITTLFQPIVESRSGRLTGYEALSRGPVGSPFFGAPGLLGAADKVGLGPELRFLTAKLAFERFMERELEGKLFVNVNPQTFLDGTHTVEKILDMLSTVNLSPDRVVAELTELVDVEDKKALHRQCEYAREKGFTIAIDDVGSGYSGLTLWSSVQPEIIKLDRHFSFGIDQDAVKKSFVSSVVDLCSQLDCGLIAEGVETPEEYSTLIELGVSNFQGYLFGTPEEVPTTGVKEMRLLKGAGTRLRAPLEKACDLCRPNLSIPPNLKLCEVEEIFLEHKSIDTLVIIAQSDVPVGLMHRDTLYRIFSQRPGRELNERKAVLKYADREIVVVDENDYLDSVSRKLNQGSNQNYIRQRFVITRNGQFLGLGHTRDLLNKMTEYRVKQAIYSNPLTQLPGQVPLSEDLSASMSDGFDLIYFDLDNFKAFNDKYGYRKGDDAIRLLANTIQHYCQSSNGRLYHIGGDDFVVVWQGEDIPEVCQKIKTEFEKEVVKLYDAQDKNAGFIEACDRYGELKTYSLMTVSVGIVQRSSGHRISEYALSQRAAEVKKKAKNSHSVVVWKEPATTSDAG